MTVPVPPSKPQLQPVSNTRGDDMDDWLADLAGKSSNVNSAAAGDTHQTLLRAAILRKANQTDSALASDAHAWQRLQFKLRQEGLAKQPTRSRFWLLAAGVAGLSICTLLVWQMSSSVLPTVEVVQKEPPEWRESELVAAEVNEQPQQTAYRMATALSGSGTTAKVYEFRGKYVVEFKADSERLYEIQRVSGELGLRTQIALGKNRVVFTRKVSSPTVDTKAPPRTVEVPAISASAPPKDTSKP